MKIIEFRGHSDDTFGYDVIGNKGKRVEGDDHDDCANGTVRTFEVLSQSTSSGVLVIGVYDKCPAAVWAIGLAPLDEDSPFPAWAERPEFRTDGYTPVLKLHAPDDTTIRLVHVDGKAPKKDEDE